MFDDFFIRALIAGIGIALVTGPLGCFIIWRRLAFFGDTLAHSALLGVTLAFTFEISIALSVFIISSIIALILLKLQKNTKLPGDALLGLLAHSSLAVGLVVIGFLSFIRFDIMGFLFGDILAINRTDIVIIWIGGLAVLAALALIWKSLFAATVNYEIAVAAGLKPDRANFFFMVLMAAVIAISMKIVGVLLITALLIIPVSTARRFAITPEMMAVVASIIGAASVWIGLEGSLRWDTPAGPSIVVAALLGFILSLLPVQWLYKRLNFNRPMRG